MVVSGVVRTAWCGERGIERVMREPDGERERYVLQTDRERYVLGEKRKSK